MTKARQFAITILDLIPSTLSLSNATLLMYEAEKHASADYAFVNELKEYRKNLLAINDSNPHAWPKRFIFGLERYRTGEPDPNSGVSVVATTQTEALAALYDYLTGD